MSKSSCGSRAEAKYVPCYPRYNKLQMQPGMSTLAQLCVRLERHQSGADRVASTHETNCAAAAGPLTPCPLPPRTASKQRRDGCARVRARRAPKQRCVLVSRACSCRARACHRQEALRARKHHVALAHGRVVGRARVAVVQHRAVGAARADGGVRRDAAAAAEVAVVQKSGLHLVLFLAWRSLRRTTIAQARLQNDGARLGRVTSTKLQ
eukprot:6175141-Pleurochrysis_carterae.AAC.2